MTTRHPLIVQAEELLKSIDDLEVAGQHVVGRQASKMAAADLLATLEKHLAEQPQPKESDDEIKRYGEIMKAAVVEETRNPTPPDASEREEKIANGDLCFMCGAPILISSEIDGLCKPCSGLHWDEMVARAEGRDPLPSKERKIIHAAAQENPPLPSKPAEPVHRYPRRLNGLDGVYWTQDGSDSPVFYHAHSVWHTLEDVLANGESVREVFDHAEPVKAETRDWYHPAELKCLFVGGQNVFGGRITTIPDDIDGKCEWLNTRLNQAYRKGRQHGEAVAIDKIAELQQQLAAKSAVSPAEQIAASVVGYSEQLEARVSELTRLESRVAECERQLRDDMEQWNEFENRVGNLERQHAEESEVSE